MHALAGTKIAFPSSVYLSVCSAALTCMCTQLRHCVLTGRLSGVTCICF